MGWIRGTGNRPAWRTTINIEVDRREPDENENDEKEADVADSK